MNVSQLAMGSDHGCALTNGEVRCWGKNDHGQLGNGLTTASDTPVTVRDAATGTGALRNVLQIAAQGNTTCARLQDGTVRCWGSNTDGLIGNGSTAASSNVPVAVTGITNATQIDVGSSHACARVATGEIRCWGRNVEGQLGDRTWEGPRRVPGNGALCCPGDTEACTSGCVNLQTDNNNCGGCGRTCGTGTQCTAGHCLPATACSTCVYSACETAANACARDATCRAWLTCHAACNDDACRARCTNASTPLAMAVTSCQATQCAGPCRGRRLVAGEDQTCAIRRNATDSADELVCWGQGHNERCEATTDSNVVEVAVGSTFRCVRTSDNRASCVGSGTLAVPNLSSLEDVVQVVAEAQRACARLKTGTVYCSSGDAPVAVRTSAPGMTGLTGVVEIAAGDDHTCARLQDGTVQCWGSNTNGQLGNGGTTTSASSVAVTGLSNVVEIAAGDLHTCAQLQGGDVRCWGSNAWGQLGDGSTMQRSAPVAVTGLSNAVEIAAGGAHTCARLSGGTVRCWGANTFGQLGNNSTTDSLTPVAVTGLTGVVEIAAGANHTCARLQNGDVRCWGDNRDGRLGVAATTMSSTTPVLSVCVRGCAVNGPEIPMSMPSRRASTTCGLACVDTQTNNAHCGSCGTRCTDSQTCTAGVCGAPMNCAGPLMACGSGTTAGCFNLENDARHCGMCGNACGAGRVCVNRQCARAPATQVAAGASHTCVITGGAVRCWGSDASGQRGDGTTVSGDVCSGPAEIPGMPLSPAVEIAAGHQHTCAIVEVPGVGMGAALRREVRCWGHNDQGQLGNGTMNGETPTLSPVAVVVPSSMPGGMQTNLTDVVEITAGYAHTCALLQGGEVRCWGDNREGQLGNSTPNNSTTPVAVVVPSPMPGGMPTNLTNVVEIAAGAEHTCARLQSGEVRCWGDNLQLQLGNTAAGGASPVAVEVAPPMPGGALTNLTDVVEIAAGRRHTCARLQSGEVRCWGLNGRGQLGNETPGGASPLAVLAPSPMPGGMPTNLTNVVGIAAGDDYTCARLQNREVRCWGLNNNGQLGNGDPFGFDSFSAVAVVVPSSMPGGMRTNLTNVVEITAGGEHACARLQDGAVQCWGKNEVRQLGDGTTDNRRTPVTALCPAATTCMSGQMACGAGCCRMGEECQNGRTCSTPMSSCAMGRTSCGSDGCVDVQSDPRHCGSCGRSCQTGWSCVRGTCTAPTPVCTQPDDCPTGQICRDSRCVSETGGACPTGRISCGGSCVDPQTSITHCGSCDNACGTGQMCMNSMCVPGTVTCPTGQVSCDDRCVDPQTNNAYCGGCDNACTDGSVCMAGTCRAPMTCATGTTSCMPTGCVNTQTDLRHCGNCMTACADGQLCRAGVCATATATRVAPGFHHTCAITDAGVQCWGYDASGQRGDGPGISGARCSGPATLPGTPVAITSGYLHTCVRIMGGTVSCWGDNRDGQLGNGESGLPNPTPVTVMGLTNAVEVSAGGYRTCALLTDATVTCWGRNVTDIGLRESSTPVAVRDLTNVVEIAVGAVHACARRMDGTVRCWGFNTAGTLGDGTTTQSLTPVAVMGLTNAVEIAVGDAHSCARIMDGTVRCWGSGNSGQLGTGATTRSLTPVAVPGLSNVVEITAGQFHTCARLMDGTVRCWGRFALGPTEPSTMNALSPVAIAGLSDVVELVAGSGHTCARRQNNEIRCWGYNARGQLGDGGMMSGTTPVVARCTGSMTTCPMGQLSCGGSCVDPQTSIAHCGGCNRPCLSGQMCVSGVCAATCSQTLCGGMCVDTQTNVSHCGMCSRVCALPNVATNTCAAGTCGVGACAMNFGNCDGMAANGCETNVRGADTNNCGACGARCALTNVATPSCAAGVCGVGTCATGFANCDNNAANGCEANTQTSNTHCGACNNACPSGQVCANGVCASTCTQTLCSGACVDTQTNVSHCGSCGRVCALANVATQSCASGVCGVGTCATGFGNCNNNAADGCETNTQTTLAHCGGCGMACAPLTAGLASCTSGACVRTCPPNTHAVGTACIADGGPKLVGPISLGEVTQLRPRFAWINPANADGAFIEVCNDRACNNIAQTIMAPAVGVTPTTAATATTALDPARTYYWRARVMVGSAADTANNSPVWLFHTPQGNRGMVQTSVRPHLDVNADGFDDLAVAAPNAGSGAGRVDVYLGGSSGLSSTVHRSFTGAAEDRLGTSVSPAGDVNGDGYGDLLVGAPGASSGRGSVRLYLGGPTGLPMDAAFTATGATAGDALGTTVTGAGDVNLDGYADIVAGAPGANSRAGTAVWYRGAASVTALPATTLSGTGGANLQFGLTLVGVGDVNGDGYSDVLVGEPGFNSNQGRLHTFFGGTTGLPTTTTSRLNGGTMGDRFTEGLSGAGDLNGDGYSDAMSAAPLALGMQVGGFNVFTGGIGGLTTASVPAGNISGAGFGRALAGVGDVNGDNRDDVLIAAPYFDSNRGRVYLAGGPAVLATGIFGFPTLLFQQQGDAQYSALGAAVAGAGDVNGDGLADVAFGAPGESVDAFGRVYLLRGSRSPLTSPAPTFVTSSSRGDRYGAAISSHEAQVPDAPASCPTGQSRCSGTCVELISSTTNCGGCGVACGMGQTCTAGMCMGGMTCGGDGQAACAGGICNTGLTSCSGTCRNLNTTAFCGSCTNNCNTLTGVASATCTAGACSMIVCTTGLGNCDGMPTNGCETSLNTTTHCGACGVACAMGQTCTGGVCMGSSCGPGTTACGSECCTSTQTCAGARCRERVLTSSDPSTVLGEMGALPVAIACASNQLLTGFEGMSSGMGGFEQIRGTCVEARLIAGTPPTIPLSGPSVTTMPSGRSAFGAFPFGIGCPPGAAVIGIQVAASDTFRGLQLRCAPVVVSADGAGFAVARGTVNVVSGIGTDPFSGAPPFGPAADCPGSGFARGFAGTLNDLGSATSHRSIGLTCATLSITP